MGVFGVTAVSSVFAYVWLYIVLGINSKDEVTIAEGIITLCFFFVLIILAYGADKYRAK
jgi:solute carrier family 8 (sodium/calcium exchanger)